MNRLIKSLGIVVPVLLAGINPVSAQTLDIASSGDFGNSHANYPSRNAVDGDTAFDSRWAATFDGGSANLFVDLGSRQTIDNIGVAWGRGSGRSYDFEVRARAGTRGKWTRIFRGTSSGRSDGIENYNVDDISAQQVRVKVYSNSAGTRWADITEFEVYGTRGRSGGNSGSDTEDSDDRTFSIPTLIQAEDFSDFRDADTANQGGQYRNTPVDIERCFDANCGFNVGWFGSGEYLEYELDVSDSGNYVAQVRVASTQAASEMALQVDGVNAGPTTTVGNTGGYQNWQTRTVELGNINAGTRTLRLSNPGTFFNVNWINIVPSTSASDENFGLDRNRDPWDNFDLRRWALDTPDARDDDRCRAQRTWEYQWSDSNPLNTATEPFFFTHTDGGMRFVTRIDGQTTNKNCNEGFVRSELREMLRAGDRSIDDTSVSRNNWKLGYQPGRDSDWGGVNGQLDATLRVNKVTTTGDSGEVGRVIVGQIHADDDEPLRLYYRKRAGNSKGCVYFGHEIRGADDEWFEMIGDRDCTSNPSNGIELDELFSYSIINDDEDITVIIRRGDSNGTVIARQTIDMNSLNSGYDRSDEWMYFKAGAYTQNDSGRGSDGDIVTFYRLNASHD